VKDSKVHLPNQWVNRDMRLYEEVNGSDSATVMKLLHEGAWSLLDCRRVVVWRNADY